MVGLSLEGPGLAWLLLLFAREGRTGRVGDSTSAGGTVSIQTRPGCRRRWLSLNGHRLHTMT